MVLESTIVCVDNSEWMRNGDFPPSRLDAQQDAANLLATIKLQANPENTVGILTTAGTSARVLITSTQDSGKVLTCLRSVSPSGTADIVAAMQKAQLALKHRQNQAQRQRIVLFVGSPIGADEAVLVALGKKLKKNAVAVDVINFGESVENEAKLNAFIAAVNADENSHLLSVASGTAILADAIMPSPIVSESGGGGGGGGSGSGAGNEAFPFGVDPAVDPELVMALRMSMEEEEARRAAAAAAESGGSGDAAAADASGSGAGAAASALDAASGGGTIAGADEVGVEGDDAELYDSGDADDGMDLDARGGADDDDDEEGDETEEAEADMLVQALEASHADAQQDEDDEDMDEDLRRAIELSKQDFDGGGGDSGGDEGDGSTGGSPDGSSGSA